MLQWKVCGTRDARNIEQINALHPDYIGFIFYEKSKRFVGEQFVMPERITSKKVGVFVDTPLEKLVFLAKKYSLDALQLHGNESAEFCEQAKAKTNLPIVKAFGVGKGFNFAILETYLGCTNAFLLDTQGKEKGGNGIAFNWAILKEYPYQHALWISGGIGLDNVGLLLDFLKRYPHLPIQVLDINSCFESQVAFKNISLLETFQQTWLTRATKY